MVPHLVTALNGPINELEQRVLDSMPAIERWFRLEWMEHTPPFYSSVDIRNAGFKLAPVDNSRIVKLPELMPAGQIAKALEIERETLRRMIEFHMLWLRDLMRAQVGAPAELLVHRDREREIREQATKVTPTEIRRRLLALEEALQSIEGNVSPDLTIFSAMVRVGGRRIGEGQWPPHAAARSEY